MRIELRHLQKDGSVSISYVSWCGGLHPEKRDESAGRL